MWMTKKKRMTPVPRRLKSFWTSSKRTRKRTKARAEATPSHLATPFNFLADLVPSAASPPPPNPGRYSDQYILEFYKQKLKSKPCQNQGFILDGFPKTYEQAKQLFAGTLTA